MHVGHPTTDTRFDAHPVGGDPSRHEADPVVQNADTDAFAGQHAEDGPRRVRPGVGHAVDDGLADRATSASTTSLG